MKKISLAILTLIVVLASCKKTPEVNLKYVDVERDLVTVGTTTANIQCDYEYIATLKKAYLYYGEGESETNMTSAEMRVVQNTLYVELTGLKENTLYSFYYEFHNGFNSMRTALKNFKTEAGNGGGEEPPTPPEIMLPTVITAAVTEITTNTAQSGGEVTNDGGAEVTERGICWSTNENPTLNDNHVAAGTGIGAFTAMMDGLEANTTYHVRAYATNEAGTAYGLDREFVTISGGGSGVPEGAIDGLFSVSPTQKVYFSQGNLQYQASTNTWRFAENQWDYVGSTVVGYGEPGGNVNGSSNHLISELYEGWIDLFGWGTSGWNSGNVYYQPYNYESLGGWNAGWCGYGYGPTDGTNYNYSLTGIYANSDWGVYNSISNGGNVSNQWRTLTQFEWDYIFNVRNTASGIRYAMAQVNNVNGVVLLPDNWNSSIYQLNDVNQSDTGFGSNVIAMSIWIDTLQENGAVFLPASGSRNGTAVFSVNYYGYYWSATYRYDEDAYSLGFYDHHDHLPIETDCSHVRYAGLSVRLVQDANTQNIAK